VIKKGVGSRLHAKVSTIKRAASIEVVLFLESGHYQMLRKTRPVPRMLSAAEE
jgi:hypothetical protein